MNTEAAAKIKRRIPHLRTTAKKRRISTAETQEGETAASAMAQRLFIFLSHLMQPGWKIFPNC